MLTYVMALPQIILFSVDKDKVKELMKIEIVQINMVQVVVIVHQIEMVYVLHAYKGGIQARLTIQFVMNARQENMLLLMVLLFVSLVVLGDIVMIQTQSVVTIALKGRPHGVQQVLRNRIVYQEVILLQEKIIHGLLSIVSLVVILVIASGQLLI